MNEWKLRAENTPKNESILRSSLFQFLTRLLGRQRRDTKAGLLSRVPTPSRRTLWKRRRLRRPCRHRRCLMVSLTQPDQVREKTTVQFIIGGKTKSVQVWFLPPPFRNDDPAKSTAGVFIAADASRAIHHDPRSTAQHLQAAAHHL